MISLTPNQKDLLASGRAALRSFVWCDAVDSNGDPDPAGFCSEDYSVIVSGRTYHGLGLFSIGTIRAVSDLTAQTAQITLSGVNSRVVDLVRGNMRGQEHIESLIGLFDPDTRELVDGLIPIFDGFIDTIEFPRPPAGGTYSVLFNCESSARALTRAGTGTRTDTTHRLAYPDDGFLKYVGIQREKPNYFGRRS